MTDAGPSSYGSLVPAHRRGRVVPVTQHGISRVTRHIRLLISDLDYLLFECASLKVKALRQSLISLADTLPLDIALPDTDDAEKGFRAYGFQWFRYLENEWGEDLQERIRQAYGIHEIRLVEAGMGRLHPGVKSFVSGCRESGLVVALGADASRDYLVTVSDRFHWDTLFHVTLCTEEFGSGGAAEMMAEIMRQSEVNPSETLALGTRPDFFHSARELDIASIGCGWGIRNHEALSEADFKAFTLNQLNAAIREADSRAAAG